MPDRDAATIRNLIYYQNAKIIGKSTFAVSDEESGLKLRGDKKFYNSIPPVLHNCPNCSATLGDGDLRKPHLFVGREMIETKNRKGVPEVPPDERLGPMALRSRKISMSGGSHAKTEHLHARVDKYDSSVSDGLRQSPPTRL